MTTPDSRHLVDPELAPMLEVFPALALSDEALAGVRENRMVLPVEPAADAAVASKRRRVPGPTGAPEIEVLCYRPMAATGALPCILHIHGGGYVLGDAASMAAFHKPLALELNCAIVSVDYRLAPETRAPGAVEDCYAGLSWLVANAGEIGVDSTRIGLMGESAGGGLAAALALLARDRKEHALAFQHLIYPMLDDRTCANADPHPHAGEFVWTAASNRFGWSALLGVAPGSDGVSPYASPARARDLAGLPPAFISTGALDLFVEEDMDYARRLIRAGVPTELHVYPGAFHGFDFAAGTGVAERSRRDSRAALARALR
ncbi:MAG TPA: alpha/beta hydrolase [Caulobacteraceae bacterium]